MNKPDCIKIRCEHPENLHKDGRCLGRFERAFCSCTEFVPFSQSAMELRDALTELSIIKRNINSLERRIQKIVKAEQVTDKSDLDKLKEHVAQYL